MGNKFFLSLQHSSLNDCWFRVDSTAVVVNCQQVIKRLILALNKVKDVWLICTWTLLKSHSISSISNYNPS